mmetsp:Transcript_16815/g.21923  ORF Transcript_16815/g.21923 Transcript_16815/m.21923 type:complete len:272 (+) Transcript_16815:632-1447(+)
MDTRVGHKIGLKFSDIHIQSTIKTKRGGQRGDDLSNQTIQVLVRGSCNAKAIGAHIVQSLVIQGEGTIRMFQKSMGRQDRVVRLDNRSRNLRRRSQGKRKLGLATVINTQTFQQERTKTRTGTSSRGVEDQKTLQSSTVIGQLTDTVNDGINNLLAGGVMTTGVVVGGIFLSVDNLFRVVQRLVDTRTNFITDRGFQISVDGTRNVLSSGSFTKKGVEGIVFLTRGTIRRHFTVGLNAMLQAVKFPALVTNLDTTLAQMNRNYLTHILKLK